MLKFLNFIFWLLFYDINLPVIKNTSILLVLFLFVAFYPKYFINTLNDKFIFKLFTILLLSYAFILIRTIFGEYSYLLTSTKVYMTIVLSSIITLVVLRKFGVKMYITIFMIIIFIQSLSPYLYYTFDYYKELVISVQNADAIRATDVHNRGIMAIRKSFLSGNGGFFGMSIALGIALFVSTWFYIKGYIKNRFIYILFFIVVAIASLIAARSSLIFIAMSMVILFYYSSQYKFFFTLFSIILFSTVIFLFLEESFILGLTEEFILLKWIFEPIVNYYNYGDLESNSLNGLYEMYFIPELSTLLFGDGFYKDLSYSSYIYSDSGYLRQILFGGILMIVFSLIYIIYSTKFLPYLFRITIIFLLLLAHAKGSIILLSPNSMAIFSSFIAFVYYESILRDKERLNNERS